MRELQNHRNGKLVAIKPVGKSADGHVTWLCQCDCGDTKVVQANNLTRDAGTKSCGCLNRAAAQRRVERDGSWNEGKSYTINGGGRCYKTRHAWSKAALKHHGSKCQDCGWDKARCDVHHITPKAQGGKHVLSNARVICPNCHRIRHEQGERD